MQEIENEEIIQYDKFDQKIILHSYEMDICYYLRESCFTKHVLVQGWQSHSTLMLGSSTFTALLSLEEGALEKKKTFLKEGSTMLKCAATIENTPRAQAHHHLNDLAPPEIPGCPRPALPQVLSRSRARWTQGAAGAADHCERTLKFEHEIVNKDTLNSTVIA